MPGRANTRPVRGITADTVRALLGLRHAGSDCAYLPIERTQLADHIKGSAPAPSIDLADVPATLRDDCDAYPAKPIARPVRGKQGFVIIDEAASFSSVAPPIPSSEGDDEARSAGPTEPTAPTNLARLNRVCQTRVDGRSITEKANAAAVAKERRASGADDRTEPARPDQGGRPRRVAGKDIKAGRVSRSTRSGHSARSACGDASPQSSQPERDQNPLAITRRYAGEFDFRPIAPVAPKPDPIAQRREALERAIRFLKSRCILVDIVDRSAAIRTYRVTGKRDRMLAEQVIEHAVAMGMETPNAG